MLSVRARDPGLSIPTEHLRWWGWQPWSVVERCGHQIDGLPVPARDGRWRLIVVEGGAR
jgi:hypothetical protein